MIFKRIKKDRIIEAQKEAIQRLHRELEEQGRVNALLNLRIRELEDEDLFKWNIIIHQKNELLHEVERLKGIVKANKSRPAEYDPDEYLRRELWQRKK